MVKRKNTSKQKEKNNIPDYSEKDKVEHVLIENFVSLQKVMTNLAVKFDSLSSQISKLLELFEISAKTLAEKGEIGGDKKVAEKLDNLLEQNKIIAKGITLLHEKEANPIEQRYSSSNFQRNPPQQERGNMNTGYSRQPIDLSKNPRFGTTHV